MGYLSAYLKSHPALAGMSNRRFAESVGIGSSTADAILGGRSIPEERTLRKIADAFPAIPFVELRDKAWLDIPFELPEGAEVLDAEQRGLVRDIIKQFIRASGKEDQVPREEPEQREAQGGSNVVELPRPQVQRVQKAAYDPPRDE